MCDTVDSVASETLTNVCLGFGDSIIQTGGLSEKLENGLTIMVSLKSIDKFIY